MQFEWRVPVRYQAVEPRKRIKITFATDSETAFRFESELAKRRLIEEWESRLNAGSALDRDIDINRARVAKAQAFKRRPREDFHADAAFTELARRLEHVRAATPEDAPRPADLLGALLTFRAPAAAVSDQRRVSEVAAHDAEVNPRKSAATNAIAVARFIAAVGDKRVADISPVDAEAFLVALRRDAASRKRAQGDAAHTIQRRFASMKGIWTRWAKRAGVKGDNPLSAVELDRPKAAQDGRLGFHRWHLALIAAGRCGRAQTRAQLELMKQTGMGPHELAGLLPDDLFLDEAIPYVHIRDNARRTLGKSSGRARRIPIIGLDAATVKAALVPAWKPRAADALSAKLNKALRAAGVPTSSRLTCYSFRHGFKQALRAASVPLMIQDRLMGHASETGAAASYGNRSALMTAKRDAVAAALPLLGDTDPVDYSLEELPAAAR